MKTQETPDLSTAKKQEVIAILKAYGIRRAALFGSFARGTAHAESDVDLLIDPPAGFTLFNLSALGRALEATLERQVDLVTYRALRPHFAQQIKADLIPLFTEDTV